MYNKTTMANLTFTKVSGYYESTFTMESDSCYVELHRDSVPYHNEVFIEASIAGSTDTVPIYKCDSLSDADLIFNINLPTGSSVKIKSAIPVTSCEII